MARLPSLVCAALVSTGCLTDQGTVNRPAQFRKIVATDDQIAIAGGRTPLPMKVSVLADDGSGVVRVGIAWDITDGPTGGVLSDTLTLTDGLGTAQASLELGPDQGTYTVRAALAEDPTRAVRFTVTARPGPQITSLTPRSFSTGDTVIITGANFTASTRFRVGNRTAEIVSISALGFGAQIVVPACLPDDSVAVRAVLLGVESPPVRGRNTPVTGTLNLAPGEYVSVPASEVVGCAALPAAGPDGAEYLIAPQLVGGGPDTGVSYRLQNGPVPVQVEVRPPAAVPFATAFHSWLRDQEAHLAATRDPSGAVQRIAAPAAPVLVGQTRDFVVCDVFPCQSTDDFADVRAVARFVGQHAVIYLDRDAPAGGLADSDFAALGAVFDEQLYQVATRAFGAESDVDQNGRVVILMTPRVNRLTQVEDCETAFVTGFFLALDVDPFFGRDPRSNQGEVFYSFVADPTGSVTCEHSLDRVRRSVPVTFVHEFQHMINYHQHVVLRGGQTEVTWLNEGMSHLAEELAALQFRALGDNTNFNRYVIGNLLNAYTYLRDPSRVEVLETGPTVTLAQRGAAWLFLRWLTDTHGGEVARRLAESGRRGVENVRHAAGRPSEELLSEWYLANWASDLIPDSIVPPRLHYLTWEFRTTFASLNEQAPDVFQVAFPITPDTLPSTGPFAVGGTMFPGSGAYYVVVQAPGDPAVSFQFTDASGGPLASDGEPRLNIVRVR